jgi:hypothetical protein
MSITKPNHAIAFFVGVDMPRRKKSHDPEPGELHIRGLAGQRRMVFRQLDGSDILADYCTCLGTVPNLECPVDIHQVLALQILSEGETDATKT